MNSKLLEGTELATYAVCEISSGKPVGSLADQDVAVAMASDATVTHDPANPNAVALIRDDGQGQPIILGAGAAVAARALATTLNGDEEAGERSASSG